MTNGITWQFYLPLEEGNWEQRRFFTIDLMEQSIEDSSEKFVSLLARGNIEYGHAYEYAKSLYEGRQKNKIIKENLPIAWQKLISEPDEILIELLNDTLEKTCGYKAEIGQVIEFLRQKTSVSILSPQIQKVQNTSTKQKTVNSPQSNTINTQKQAVEDVINLGTDLLSNLFFTKIIEGQFADKSATNWRKLINTGLKLAFDKGFGAETLRQELKVNLKEGKHKTDGFSFVEGTNFSLQGQDANVTANNVLKLAKFLKCEIYILLNGEKKVSFQ